MHLKNKLTSISNIFVMPELDKLPQSIFQGFLSDLFFYDYIICLRKFLLFPHDVMEIFMSNSDLTVTRNAFSHSNTFLLSPKAIRNMPHLLDAPFTIITYIEKHEEFVQSILDDFIFKPITVSTNNNADINLSNEYNFFCLDSLIYKQIEICAKNSNYKKYLEEVLPLKQREKKTVDLDIPTRNHAVTHANESVLLSLGYTFTLSENITPSPEPDNYINAIIDSSDYVLMNTTNFKSMNKSDLILHSPSIFSYLYKFNSHWWNQIFRKFPENKSKEFLKNGILKNPNYSGFNIEIESGKKFNPFEVPMLREMLFIRQAELALNSISVAFLAISNNAPAIRLPNSVNFHNAQLKDLESFSIRSDKKGKLLFKKKFLKLTKELEENIGKELIEYVCKYSKSITINSDVPIEWISFCKIPLMFSHETSNIYGTPGNLLLTQSSLPVKLEINRNDLRDILIIRSFNDNDPIKRQLEFAVNHFSKIDNVLNINFVDVSTSEELIENLNKFNGFIVIFDCHGNHGGNESHGWLQIGSEKVDTWNLANETRIPPIVILSACLTAAVSGSHASVANGFLSSGAMSIIGTFLPVEPVRAAIFVGRIIYRISGFVDALAKLKYTHTTWRAFISGFFRMSYATDILRAFQEDFNLISLDEYSEIHTQINMKINLLDDNWFNYLIESVSEKCQQTTEELYFIVAEEIPIVDTMCYRQIGRPENIIINIIR